MTNKHNPDQLAEAAVVSESPDLKQAEGDAPAAKNLPKRRISGDQSQNKQAPNRKKSKLAVPPTVVASRAHDDKNNQEATSPHPESVGSEPLLKKDPPPPALAGDHGSGHADSMAAAEPSQSALHGDQPQGQTQQDAPPAHPPPPPSALHPTDDDLCLLVKDLKSCLATEMTYEQHTVMGANLRQRKVLAKLGKRRDYLDIMNDKELAPKLAGMLHAEFQKVVGSVYQAFDEGKHTTIKL